MIHAALPAVVRGFSTTRAGGCSLAPFASLNLGSRCGDQVEAVFENRRRLEAALPMPPLWLQQVHGTRVLHLDDWRPEIEADASWTDRPGQVAVVLTADCLPILVGDACGRCVAAIHAGWRGLAHGVIAATLEALPVQADRLHAWIGPRISAVHYPVGPELVEGLSAYEFAFQSLTDGRWLADLPAIAIAQLQQSGLKTIVDSGLCSHADHRFFSVRRERPTGRIASLIWIP